MEDVAWVTGEIKKNEEEYNITILGEKKELEIAENQVHEIISDYFNLIAFQWKMT